MTNHGLGWLDSRGPELFALGWLENQVAEQEESGHSGLDAEYARQRALRKRRRILQEDEELMVILAAFLEVVD